jgi:hypothetical protein
VERLTWKAPTQPEKNAAKQTDATENGLKITIAHIG